MILKKLSALLLGYLTKVLTPRSGISSRRLVLLLTLVQFCAVEWFCLIANRQVQEELLLYPMIIILSGLGLVSVDSFKGLSLKKTKHDDKKSIDNNTDTGIPSTPSTRPIF